MLDVTTQTATATTGTLVGWKADKGYGFLSVDGSDNDVFLHISSIDAAGLEAPRIGQHFSFDIIPDRRGRRQAANRGRSDHHFQHQ